MAQREREEREAFEESRRERRRRAGRRSGAPSGSDRSWIWWLAGAAVLVVLAIGGGVLFIAAPWDGDGGTPREGGLPLAREVAPDLSSLGYVPTETGRDPFVPEDIDHARALYGANDGSLSEVIVQVYVYPDEIRSTTDYANIVAAYASAPLGTLLENPLTAGDPTGGPAANEEGEGPVVGEAQQSFVTLRADSNNNGVTTDVFREGRLVAVIQLLDSATEDHLEVRADIAQRILDRWRG